ncbi:zinc-dependent alcohol dehydrogenase [Rhodoligotrophos defluvii]|uniref:zinc-dependent alcohol dehydrogenase n=1 Tax=Rhodoligotrophos defluvii TaxID=2561934 RepID=UPI001EF0488E|nr:zinc-binding alcohol dehydrogenase [Rhodoligotrophos defluvii]
MPLGAMPRALFYVAPGRAELRAVEPRKRSAGVEICLVRTCWSGLSRGTERLVFQGRLPPSEWQRMRAPFQEGDFPFPVKYGYSAVGRVERGPPDLVGRHVFCLYPHQDQFEVEAAALVPLSEGVPLRRAILSANLETALNVIWDSGAAPGDRITIIGGGIVGLLVCYLAAALPGAEVTLVDIASGRAEIAHLFGAHFAAPEDAPGEADIVIHASGSPQGLALALELAGTEGTIVEASWFGDQTVGLPLGAAFHSRRLRLIASQVGMVATARRARWTHRRRLEKAVSLLRDDRLDRLVTHEVGFDDLAGQIAGLLKPGAPGLMAAVRYRAE